MQEIYFISFDFNSPETHPILLSYLQLTSSTTTTTTTTDNTITTTSVELVAA